MFETHKTRRILEDLDAEDERVRAKALGQIKDNPRIIEALGAMLKNTNEDVALRQRAAQALGQFGDARVLEPLVFALLQDKNFSIQAAAGQALGCLGDVHAVEVLWRILMSDAPPNVLRLAAQALGQRRDPRAVEPLVTALQSQDDVSVRRQAAEALGQIGDARAVEPLMGALKDHNRDVQRAAKESLAKMGEPAITPLIEALKDPNREMRQVAVGVLKLLSWQPRDNTQRAWQAIALEQWEEVISLGAPAVEPLLEALKDESWEVQAAAAQALGTIGDDRAVQPLVEMLKDSGVMGSTVTEALVRFGKAAVEPLIEVLKISNQAAPSGQRSIAAKVLGDIGDARAVEPLVEMLKNSLQGEAAAGALKSLGWQPSDNTQRAWQAVALRQWEEAISLGGFAVEPLVAALKDPWILTQVEAAQALGTIGDARAVEPLLEALKDESWGAAKTIFQESPRWEAAKALTSLGWQPKDNTQRARQAIALRQWGEVISLGAPAVEPLMRAAMEEKTMAKRMMQTLQKTLERSATDMAPEDLWAVIGLTNVVQVETRGDGYNKCGIWSSGQDYEDEIDCSHLRQLARQELIRRGLEA